MQNREFPHPAEPQSAAGRHLRASPARARQALRRPQTSSGLLSAPAKPVMTAGSVLLKYAGAGRKPRRGGSVSGAGKCVGAKSDGSENTS